MDSELLAKAHAFATSNAYTLGDRLGFGIHGAVWNAVNHDTGVRVAMKVFEHDLFFRRENDAYERLQEHDVVQICGCHVPQLVMADPEVPAMMLTVVARPFVLDFAGSRLDEPELFPLEIVQEFYAEKEAQFGSDWPRALKVVRALESFGIYLTDISPSNIALD